jgi:solute carrier family 6 serotonin transporter-like protein 4
MYLELAAGQYFQSGNITIWAKMNPYMKGIGYAVLVINFLMLSYYNTLQAYALYYLANSFQSPVPWSACNHPWNTQNCHARELSHTLSNNNKNLTGYDDDDDTTILPATEFFSRKVLGSHLSNGSII